MSISWLALSRYAMQLTLNGSRNPYSMSHQIGKIKQEYEHQKDEVADIFKASSCDFLQHYSELKNFQILFGFAWSWFSLDVAFYMSSYNAISSCLLIALLNYGLQIGSVSLLGLSLNSSIVLTAIGFGTASTGSANKCIYNTLINISVSNIILSIAGLIPGYWVSF
ncbi:hypothetical protein CROQUDRAFT_311546 [Cronartium quercuum f. sp. fusiforme G11]|uniref:Uncharacterized protein n=1 Tax=Cronartium quercuum f. sp. fusiforme G11 TaxID=708437 RepID=A0A9P6TGS6_9BASI|nr:hypothetical protein CROQUDRAFT_311546 [Cronartium quercuum f. sp. fusiforme G11]